MGWGCVQMSFDQRLFRGGSGWFLNQESTCPDRKQELSWRVGDPVKVWREVGVRLEEAKEWY